MKKPFWIVVGIISLIITFIGLSLWISIDGAPYVENGYQVGTYYAKPELKIAVILGFVFSFLMLFVGVVRNYGFNGERVQAYGRAPSAQQSYPQASAEPTKCPRCGQLVGDHYKVCPNCMLQLRKDCPQCRGSLPVQWNACPACGYVFPMDNPQNNSQPLYRPPVVSERHCSSCGAQISEGASFCPSCGARQQ